jgi:hypothetical protein
MVIGTIDLRRGSQVVVLAAEGEVGPPAMLLPMYGNNNTWILIK